MELLYSSVIPVRPTSFSSFRGAFEEQLLRAGEINIATGYVSEDSLMELKSLLKHYDEQSNRKECDFIIGMHGREGFTRMQYEAACSLGEYLRDKHMGEVRVCTAFKFHGKIYSFLKQGKPFASIVGSSNLSGIMGADLQWETDALFTEEKSIKDLLNLHHDLVARATQPLLDFKDYKIVSQQHDLLEGRIGAERVDRTEFEYVKNNRTGLVFDIPLKAEAKSNLNTYFGKGRESKNGAVRPRPWYEVEVIVSADITSIPGYPKENEPFTVYTDDGWKFRCKVSGQNNKNLRSEDDLQTLGKWIKGRMETAGVLKVGEPVSIQTLGLYGADRLVLTATRDSNTWMLDFSPKGV